MFARNSRARNNILRGENMKSVHGILTLLLMAGLVVVMGCSGNDKDRATASSGSMPSMPTAAQGAAGAGVASGDQAVQADPSSSGGSTLPASTPYTQGKGTAVSQNVNPAPFLTASQAKPAMEGSAGSRGLVSRADGTMFGPADLPAAGIGPGTEGATQGGASRSSNAGRASGLSAPVKPSSNQTSGK